MKPDHWLKRCSATDLLPVFFARIWNQALQISPARVEAQVVHLEPAIDSRRSRCPRVRRR
jgi:hypothetical protein